VVWWKERGVTSFRCWKDEWASLEEPVILGNPESFIVPISQGGGFED